MPRPLKNPLLGPMTHSQRHANMRAKWNEVIEQGDDLSEVPFTVLLDAVRRYNRPERNLTLGDVLVEIGKRQGLVLRVEHLTQYRSAAFLAVQKTSTQS